MNLSEDCLRCDVRLVHTIHHWYANDMHQCPDWIYRGDIFIIICQTSVASVGVFGQTLHTVPGQTMGATNDSQWQTWSPGQNALLSVVVVSLTCVRVVVEVSLVQFDSLIRQRHITVPAGALTTFQRSQHLPMLKSRHPRGTVRLWALRSAQRGESVRHV